MLKKAGIALTAFTALALQMNTANAEIITYSLSNKDLGAIANPDYGLRLDGLMNGNSSESWTFHFDPSKMTMEIDTVAETARIYGDVYGGKDIGNVWDSNTTANWHLDFTYNDITIDDVVNGYWTAAMDDGDIDGNGDNQLNTFNTGTLKLLDEIDLDSAYGGDSSSDKGETIGLAAYKGGSFELNNSKGPYVSAWLASQHGFDGATYERSFAQPNDNCCQDFGFRATKVPEPSTLALLSLGLVGLGLSRRRKA